MPCTFWLALYDPSEPARQGPSASAREVLYTRLALVQYRLRDQRWALVSATFPSLFPPAARVGIEPLVRAWLISQVQGQRECNIPEISETMRAMRQSNIVLAAHALKRNSPTLYLRYTLDQPLRKAGRDVIMTM